MEVQTNKPLLKMLLELTVVLFSFRDAAPDESPMNMRVKIKPQNADLRFYNLSITHT